MKANKETYQSDEDVTAQELKEAVGNGETYEEGPPSYADKMLSEFEESAETYQADQALDDFYAKAQGVEGYDSEYEKAQKELSESFRY
jgi:hypothetical protein